MTCRRCSECATSEHHWLECVPFAEDDDYFDEEYEHGGMRADWEKWQKEPGAPECPLYWVCKHCDAWKRMDEDDLDDERDSMEGVYAKAHAAASLLYDRMEDIDAAAGQTGQVTQNPYAERGTWIDAVTEIIAQEFMN